MTIGAMNRRARLGRSRRISATTRRMRARSRRGLMPPPRPSPAKREERRLQVVRSGLRPELRPAAAGEHPPGPHEQQLVAAVGLVHDVAGHDDRGPGVRERPEVAPELDPEQRIHAHRGLVEEQHRRADGRARRRATGAAAGHPTASRRSVSARSASSTSARASVTGGTRVGAVGRGEEPGVLAHRQRRVDAVALGHVADPGERLARDGIRDAEHLRVALGRAGHPGEEADQRGLAGPVGAEQPVDPARGEVEGHPVDRRHRPEALDHETATARPRGRRRPVRSPCRVPSGSSSHGIASHPLAIPRCDGIHTSMTSSPGRLARWSRCLDPSRALADLGLSSWAKRRIIPRCSARTTWVWVPFLALGFFWGSSYLWIKIGLETLPPLTLIAGRLLLGALFLVDRRRHRPPAAPARARASTATCS